MEISRFYENSGEAEMRIQQAIQFGIPGWMRTPSEHRDAGISIVQEVFGLRQGNAVIHARRNDAIKTRRVACGVQPVGEYGSFTKNLLNNCNTAVRANDHIFTARRRDEETHAKRQRTRDAFARARFRKETTSDVEAFGFGRVAEAPRKRFGGAGRDSARSTGVGLSTFMLEPRGQD